MIVVVVILAGLPWIIRRVRGPVADARLARLVRTGGYLAVLALVLAKSAVERVADAPPNNRGGPAEAWTGVAVILLRMASYEALILVFTARRSPVLQASEAIGTVTGIALGVLAYLLGPLGLPLRFAGPWPARLYDAALALRVLLALCAPVTAGRAAARRAGRSRPAGAAARQGAMAGLCSGTAVALASPPLASHVAILPYARAPALGRPPDGQDTRARPRFPDTPPTSRLRGGQQRLRGGIPHRAADQPAGGRGLRRLGRAREAGITGDAGEEGPNEAHADPR